MASYLYNNAKHTYTSCKKVVQIHTSDTANFLCLKKVMVSQTFYQRCLSHTSPLLSNFKFYNNGLQNSSQNKESHIYMHSVIIFSGLR
jgi:hypothetical protein